MVSWKAGAILLAALVVLGVVAYQTRPRSSGTPSAALVACDGTVALEFTFSRGPARYAISRPSVQDAWVMTAPLHGDADPVQVQRVTSALGAVRVINSVAGGLDAERSGLAAPGRVVACRTRTGASYTLSIGNQSFDGSGYYAQVSGDPRVYVISSVEVDEFDRALAGPALRAGPSPGS